MLGLDRVGLQTIDRFKAQSSTASVFRCQTDLIDDRRTGQGMMRKSMYVDLFNDLFVDERTSLRDAIS